MLAACQSPYVEGDHPAEPRIIESTTRYRREYVILPGDSIDLFVRMHPLLSRTYIVRPDGCISVPLLDDVKAAGLTFGQLDGELTRRLSTRIKDPDVTVIAADIRQEEVYVIGEINQPSAVPYRRAATAAQAVALAAGFKDTAAQDRVTIIRLGDDGRLRAIPVEVLLAGQPAPMIALQAAPLLPNDIIFVPKSGIAQFGQFVREFITDPLSGVSSIVAIYTNFRLISELNRND